MKIIVTSIALLSFPHFIQSLRFGLLRIVESNVGSTNKKQSSVADFRSLFDEDVKLYVLLIDCEKVAMLLKNIFRISSQCIPFCLAHHEFCSQ